MDDLISRKALLERLHNAGGCGAPQESWDNGYDKAIDLAYGMVENAPAVDAAQVVHGRWIVLDECANEGCYCSVCYKKVYKVDHARRYKPVHMMSRFCPNCGAKMDGGNDNDCQRGDCSF